MTNEEYIQELRDRLAAAGVPELATGNFAGLDSSDETCDDED